MKRERGIVQKFNRSYGFIAPSCGGPDLFCHQSQILCDGYRVLTPGESVTFERATDAQGRECAIAVERRSGA